MDTSSLVATLAELVVPLLRQRFRPAALLLYGSHAKGDAGPASDVDLGLLAGRETPDVFELMAARTDLEALLHAPVDLVSLDDASPILAMEALRHHRLLFLDDREAWEAFHVRVLRDYFDLKTIRRPIEEALIKGRAA